MRKSFCEEVMKELRAEGGVWEESATCERPWCGRRFSVPEDLEIRWRGAWRTAIPPRNSRRQLRLRPERLGLY